MLEHLPMVKVGIFIYLDGEEYLPTRFTLIAGHTEWHDVVEVVTLIIIDSICCQVGIDATAYNIKAKTVTTVLTHSAELCLKPAFGDKVVSNLAVVLYILLSVVIYLAVKIPVQEDIVDFVTTTFKEDDVAQLSCTSDSSVDPLAIYEEEPPIENRYLVADGGALEGVACATVVVDEVLANYV